MAIPAQPTKPNRNTQTQAEFSANAEAMVEWQGDFADELNSVASTYNLSVSTTSSTSNSIGTGAKSFTVQTGLGFVVGNSVRVANTSANYMTGDVTSYDSGTGALVVNVTSSSGSGTYTDWTISLAAVGASTAADVAFTPAGGVSASDVQAAIEELDSEKLSSVTDANLDDVLTASSVGSLDKIPVATYNSKGRLTSTSTVDKIKLNDTTASTSGTSITVSSSIPTTAKKVRLHFSGVSLNGTEEYLVQLIDSGAVTSGYSGAVGVVGDSGTSVARHSTGFRVPVGSAATTLEGYIELVRTNPTTHVWQAGFHIGRSDADSVFVGGGEVTLSSSLTGVLVKSESSNTFDAGALSASWE